MHAIKKLRENDYMINSTLNIPLGLGKIKQRKIVTWDVIGINYLHLI